MEEWLSLSKISLSPFTLSVPDRLSKFGFAIILGSVGKITDIISLCVLDAVNSYEKPNILLFCDDYLIQEYYHSVFSDTGIEFKYLGQTEASLSFVSPGISNITAVSMSFSSDSEAAKKLSAIQWDLVLFAFPFDPRGIHPFIIKEFTKIGLKTKKAAAFVPNPKEYGKDTMLDFRRLFRSILLYPDRARAAGLYEITKDCWDFNINSPILQHSPFENGFYPPVSTKMSFIRYNLKNLEDENSIENSDHSSVKNRSYLYKYVFSKYSDIFNHPELSSPDIETLLDADPKLYAFNEKIYSIISENRKFDLLKNAVVIYFTDEKTLRYIEKFILSAYPELIGRLSIRADIYHAMGSVSESLFCKPSENIPPFIILALDRMPPVFSEVSNIGYVINYEISKHHSVMINRFLRSGKKGFSCIEYIIFVDNVNIYDMQIFQKSLLVNLSLAYSHELLVLSPIFYFEEVPSLLAEVITDLEYITDFTSAVGASYDIISRFKREYNITKQMSIGAYAGDYAKKLLTRLLDFFNIESYPIDITPDRNNRFDKDSLTETLKEKIALFKGEYLTLDKDGHAKIISLPEKPDYDLQDNRFVSKCKNAIVEITPYKDSFSFKDGNFTFPPALNSYNSKDQYLKRFASLKAFYDFIIDSDNNDISFKEFMSIVNK